LAVALASLVVIPSGNLLLDHGRHLSNAMPQIRLELPLHLRRLIYLDTHELTLFVPEPATVTTTLDTLEALYPQLSGTIRDHGTLKRRAFLRFFACEEDITHLPPDTPLPPAVQQAREPLILLGAIAGG
jgi:molybdopterin synthase sulfur carrier subunit